MMTTEAGTITAASRGHTSLQAIELKSLDVPPSADLPLPKVYPPLSFHVLALLAPASILGVLVRLGILALVTYDGHNIFPLAYVQAIGCLIMGFGIALKEPLGKFYGPLYTAITTGFCGSLTTFSSWQTDIFTSWTNPDHFQRGRLQDVIDGLAKAFFTLSLSLASLSLGINMASTIPYNLLVLPSPTRVVRYATSGVSVLMYGATFLAYFRLPSAYRHQATAALIFSLPGTLTRYLLSLRLNSHNRMIPMGTFTANALGTALLGAFQVLQRSATPVSVSTCALLQGLGDGYCGCLTTVSTFAAELHALPRWKACFYFVVSIAAGQLLLLVITEPPFQTGHVRDQITCKFK